MEALVTACYANVSKLVLMELPKKSLYIALILAETGECSRRKRGVSKLSCSNIFGRFLEEKKKKVSTSICALQEIIISHVVFFKSYPLFHRNKTPLTYMEMVASEHEPAVCLSGQKDQRHPALHQKLCSQQDQGSDHPLVRSAGEIAPPVMCSVLGHSF